MLQQLGCREMSAVAQTDVVGDVGDDVYHFLALFKLKSFLREIAESHSLTYNEPTLVGRNLAQ